MALVTFGEWVRWMLARHGLDRSQAARQLGVSAITITRLYRKPTPEGINDVTLSRLADLLGMTEPELMVRWKDGLPGPKERQPKPQRKTP